MGKITFERPPLVEVSFGLFFTPLREMRTAHFGVFWSKLRPDFVETADKPIVAERAASTIVVQNGWPLPRVWYVHKSKDQIVQLQYDRFYFNWRKTSDGALYPRFDSLEPVFAQHLNTLATFVEEEALGTLDISTCELTYTNHIPRGEGWSDLRRLSDLFPDLLVAMPQSNVGDPQRIAWSGTFQREQVSLRADIKHAFTNAEPKQELLVFELRAQSRQKLGGIETVRGAFSAANEAIVQTFVSLTSRKVQQEQWKRVGSN